MKVDKKIVISSSVIAIVTISILALELTIIGSVNYVVEGFGCENNPVKEEIPSCDKVASIPVAIPAIIPPIVGCAVFVAVYKKLKN